MEALARLEGLEFKEMQVDGDFVFTKNGNGYYIPDYDSHDDLQRVIDGFDYMVGQSYHTFLADITGCSVDGFIKATPAQKQEAILKAKGLWEEGK